VRKSHRRGCDGPAGRLKRRSDQGSEHLSERNVVMGISAPTGSCAAVVAAVMSVALLLAACQGEAGAEVHPGPGAA